MNSQAARKENKMKINKNIKPHAPGIAPGADAALNKATEDHKAMLDSKTATSKLENQHDAKVRSYCQKIIEQTTKTGQVYMDLCLYIRQNMVAPKLVSFVMTDMGFNRQVVSRVNKVANAADDVFSAFQARTIGFNKALDLAREPVAKSLADSMGTTVIDVKAEVEKVTDADSKPAPAASADPNAAKTKAENSISKGAAMMMSAAAFLQMKRKKVIKGNNGYMVTIQRDPTFKAKSAPQTNETEGEE